MNSLVMPKVSVAIITFNSEKFIEQAIESVLLQDYTNIEIVISDDSSSDNTPKILEKYSKQYPDKIKVLLAKRNLGATKNWFKCVKACKGKYIACLAGDDEFLPGKISKQVDIMEKDTDISICYSDASVFDMKNNVEIYRLSMKAPTLSGNIETALSDSIYYSPTVMFRKELIPEVNIFKEIKYATDLAFYKEIMIRSFPDGKIYYLPEVLYIYKKHGTNITVTFKDHYKEHIQAIKILQTKYPKYAKDLAPSIYDFCCVAFFKNIMRFEYKKSGYFLYEGVRASGGNPFKFFRALIWGIKFYIKKIF